MCPQLNINVLRHISATITVTCSNFFSAVCKYGRAAARRYSWWDRGKRFIGLTVTSAQFSSLFHTVVVSSRVTVSLRLGRCAAPTAGLSNGHGLELRLNRLDDKSSRALPPSCSTRPVLQVQFHQSCRGACQVGLLCGFLRQLQLRG